MIVLAILIASIAFMIFVGPIIGAFRFFVLRKNTDLNAKNVIIMFLVSLWIVLTLYFKSH